jgi:hypothetical protein
MICDHKYSIVSKPCNSGSLMIKSMAIVWKGKSLVGVIRYNGGFVGCVDFI